MVYIFNEYILLLLAQALSLHCLYFIYLIFISFRLNAHILFFVPFPTEGLKSQVARHSLNYIQEIGNGWFGKVKCSHLLFIPLLNTVTVFRI